MKDAFDRTSPRDHDLQRLMQQDPAVALPAGEKLVSAAMRLDAEAVTLLLKNGAPANYNDNWPLRALMHQLLDIPGRDPERIFKCAQALMDAGGGDEAAEKELMKAAIRHQNAPLLRALLERGVDVEPDMRGIGYNRMVLAAAHGFEDLVEKFHTAGDVAPHGYEEALGAAAEHGHARVMDMLIDYGTDTSKTDVVFCAVVGGQVELVKSLVARGYTTDFKEPVLVEAVVEGDHGRMLDYLFDQGADRARAHELYISASNRRGRGYAETHGTLKAWSERGETVIYTIPDLHDLSDLRQTEEDHRGHPTTLLVRLCKINRINDAVELARAAVNDRLEARDLLATDSANNTVLEILGARGHLGRLFVSDLWEKRQEDFQTLYDHIAPVYREQVDHQGLVSTWRRRALASVKDKIPRLKKG